MKGTHRTICDLWVEQGLTLRQANCVRIEIQFTLFFIVLPFDASFLILVLNNTELDRMNIEYRI